MKHHIRRNQQRKGATYVAVVFLLSGISVAGLTYLSSANRSVQDARRRAQDAQMTQLCDAGIQACLRDFWREFKQSQNFTIIDQTCLNASANSPKGVQTGSIANVGVYSAGVISISQNPGDTYKRFVTIRATGFIDRNGNNALDNNEPVKVVDVQASFELARSQIFDYTYFVNNYGWMSGFNENNLIVNGDMRANGDFTLSNGLPTINGTVIATPNDKLGTGATGTLTGVPVKWTNSAYNTNSVGGSEDNQARWRQSYDPTKHGARGSTQYQQWQDVIFDADATVNTGRINGAVLMDSNGSRNWTRSTASATPTEQYIDSAPSQEVIMPDLSDITEYVTISADYIDDKATFGDGTPNPFFNQGAWLEVWNSSQNRYDRITTNGSLSGSAILVGTSTRPIRIHGPVTVLQDVVIKGTVEGQGTIYAGRNIHIVGSIRYRNKPDFRGNDPIAIDRANEKDDILGLAARGSVIMGNPNTFSNVTLQYMQPPFTRGRHDLNGNWIPPYNAMDIDASGRRRYQSVIPDSTMNSIAEGINQLDGIIYTNFLGGGNLGTSGGGVTYNGSIISRDEAMVIWSLPMRMNYDMRIKERTLSQRPLIDIKLPRSPVLMRSTWQERGTSYGA